GGLQATAVHPVRVGLQARRQVAAKVAFHDHVHRWDEQPDTGPDDLKRHGPKAGSPQAGLHHARPPFPLAGAPARAACRSARAPMKSAVNATASSTNAAMSVSMPGWMRS